MSKGHEPERTLSDQSRDGLNDIKNSNRSRRKPRGELATSSRTDDRVSKGVSTAEPRRSLTEAFQLADVRWMEGNF